MSDLKDGVQCMECASVGRCAPTCLTKGGGEWPGKVEMAVGVTPCFMPNGERGVRITSSSATGTGRAIHHSSLGNVTAEALMGLIQAAMGNP